MDRAGTLHAPAALLPSGWASDVRITWDSDGVITAVKSGTERSSSSPIATTPIAAEQIATAPIAAGPVLPGLTNVHSHAFQRAMVGRTQRNSAPDDDFWSWRTAMYGFVEQMTPDRLEAVAEQLYSDLLRHGYTSVAEFHYLHHDPQGVPYADIAETSLRLDAAAINAGIGLTLLPVWYRYGGFHRAPLTHAQKRFANDRDRYARLLESVYKGLDGNHRLGIAPHSIRAVDADDLAFLTELSRPFGAETPIHIHISEQRSEVSDCLRIYGKRPIQWLMDHADVSPAWCLVHATHAESDELDAIAASGATVGLCPTTEADLGDGFFPLESFLERGGSIAVGSDSQVSVAPAEELRTLLYGHRLGAGRRALRGLAAHLSSGIALWQAAGQSSASITGLPVGQIDVGFRADLVVLDAARPLFDGLAPDESGTAFVLSGEARDLKRVISRGRTVAVSGRHVDEDRITARLRASHD